MNDREREEVGRAVDEIALPLTLLALAYLVSNPMPRSKHWKGRGAR